ncbi:MAG: hypothetical protein AAB653_01445 [Patescibacteria group bacterium]
MIKLLIAISCCGIIGGSVLLFFNPAVAETFGEGLKTTAEKTGHYSLIFWQPGNLPGSVGAAINVVLALLGIIFLGLIIYSGFIWMLARGNEQDVTKARDMITSAIIGLFIILGAYAITAFISVIWEKVK